MKPLKIAVLPGDGIGQDVTAAAIPIFQLLDIPVELTFGDIGWEFWKSDRRVCRRPGRKPIRPAREIARNTRKPAAK